MKNRLRKQEKAIVDSKYRQEWLYQMLYHPGKSFEKELKSFRLSAEELFVECIEVLDGIKERNRSEAEWYIGGLWDKLYCDYRDLDTQESDDEELKRAVSVVLYGIVMCLSQSSKSKYVYLCTCLMEQLNDPEHPADIVDLQSRYMSTYYRMDAAAVQEAFEAYMNCDRFISDEIDDALHTPSTDISDGLTPCIPHRFKFCKPEVTLERAKEINRVLWEYSHEKGHKYVLLKLRKDFADDVLLEGVEAADLYNELHYCYGMDDVKLRQFQNAYQKQ